MSRPIVLFAAFLAVAGCADAPAPVPTDEAPVASRPPPPATPETSAAPPNAPLVVFLGDSLTAGLGVDAEQAFPAVVARRLADEGRPIRFVNAGVSGDTTAGGLSRLDWFLRQEPDVLVISLGGNDALRALDVEMTENNLRRILVEAQEAGVRLLLTGMLAPPNLGPEYTERFQSLYRRLADELEVPLVPFLLEGVAAVAELNQSDGIHPTAQGQRRLAEVVLPYLQAVLAEPSPSAPSPLPEAKGS